MRGRSRWPDAPAPAFCLDAQTPAMTLVGVFRPQLLVTRPLIEALTEEELHAAVEHEIAHLGAWDNLKRLAMRATPDALSLLGASRGLEHDWALAAEHVADAAAAHDPATGLALASALLKVARLTPDGAVSRGGPGQSSRRRRRDNASHLAPDGRRCREPAVVGRANDWNRVGGGARRGPGGRLSPAPRLGAPISEVLVRILP